MGFTLLIFAMSENWWFRGLSLAYLVLAFIVELYVIGDENSKFN